MKAGALALAAGRFAAAALLAWVTGVDAASDLADPAEPDGLPALVGQAAWWGDYEALDRLYAEALASAELSSDGYSQVSLFLDGFHRIFNGDNNGAYYAEIDRLTGQWARAHPDSAMAHQMHAYALFSHAYYLRGRDYRDKVTPQAWRDFTQYIDLARDELTRHSSLMANDPATALHLVLIGRSAGVSFQAQWAMAKEALRRDDRMERDVYIELTTSALAKWSGDDRNVDLLAAEALKRTPTDKGLELYATVYLIAAREYPANLFDKTRADWQKVKEGFRVLLSHSPSRRNINRFAFVACVAQDKAVASELLEKIAGQPTVAQWAGGRPAFEACRRWVGST